MAAQNRRNRDVKERLVRLPEVRARTGLGTTTIYRYMREGTFPKPVPIGGTRVAWRETQLDEWIARCIEATEALTEPA